MSSVIIKHLKDFRLSIDLHGRNPVERVKQLLAEGMYQPVATFGLPDYNSVAAAEECYDLTNNPARQEEREQMYGRIRSVSVGDIVTVDDVDFVCCSFGWEIVE